MPPQGFRKRGTAVASVNLALERDLLRSSVCRLVCCVGTAETRIAGATRAVGFRRSTPARIVEAAAAFLAAVFPFLI